MSLQPQGLEPIPQATSRLAHKSSPKGTAIMRLRDALGPVYQDEAFASLFPRRGRPAEAPWRLALVTVFQAMENLSDRQAAQMVALRMDWKYALSLEPEDEGFDYTVLSQFRQRLIEQGAEDLVLEPWLSVCREHGWLKAGGKQRTDSTHVLAAVRALSSLESVGEALRAALNALAEIEPQWLLEQVEDDWFDRYVHRFELARFPKAESQREQLRRQVGRDAQRLVQATEQPEAPQAVRALPEVLAGVLAQEREQGRAPQERYVDMGYTSGPLLVQQATLGTRLVGPVATSSRWQQREQRGFTPQEFELDWQQQALEHRRREQVTPAFQKQYALRAGVEATISQGVRTQGLRQARYRGQDQVHLHHLRIAAAINLVRIDRWLEAHEQGRPARRPRPLSRFGQLQQRKVS